MEAIKLNCGKCGVRFSEEDIAVLEDYEKQGTDPLYCDMCALEMSEEE
ncbi:hypothetical protein ACQCVK_05110 [Rossellomorea vietnamensis]